MNLDTLANATFTIASAFTDTYLGFQVGKGKMGDASSAESFVLKGGRSSGVMTLLLAKSMDSKPSVVRRDRKIILEMYSDSSTLIELSPSDGETFYLKAKGKCLTNQYGQLGFENCRQTPKQLFRATVQNSNGDGVDFEEFYVTNQSNQFLGFVGRDAVFGSRGNAKVFKFKPDNREIIQVSDESPKVLDLDLSKNILIKFNYHGNWNQKVRLIQQGGEDYQLKIGDKCGQGGNDSKIKFSQCDSSWDQRFKIKSAADYDSDSRESEDDGYSPSSGSGSFYIRRPNSNEYIVSFDFDRTARLGSNGRSQAFRFRPNTYNIIEVSGGRVLEYSQGGGYLVAADYNGSWSQQVELVSGDGGFRIRVKDMCGKYENGTIKFDKCSDSSKDQVFEIVETSKGNTNNIFAWARVYNSFTERDSGSGQPVSIPKTFFIKKQGQNDYLGFDNSNDGVFGPMPRSEKFQVRSGSYDTIEILGSKYVLDFAYNQNFLCRFSYHGKWNQKINILYQPGGFKIKVENKCGQLVGQKIKFFQCSSTNLQLFDIPSAGNGDDSGGGSKAPVPSSFYIKFLETNEYIGIEGVYATLTSAYRATKFNAVDFRASDDTRIIQAEGTNKVLDFALFSRKKLVVHPRHGGENQRFSIASDNGYDMSIQSKGMCAAYNSGLRRFDIERCSNSSSQKFELVTEIDKQAPYTEFYLKSSNSDLYFGVPYNEARFTSIFYALKLQIVDPKSMYSSIRLKNTDKYLNFDVSKNRFVKGTNKNHNRFTVEPYNNGDTVKVYYENKCVTHDITRNTFNLEVCINSPNQLFRMVGGDGDNDDESDMSSNPSYFSSSSYLPDEFYIRSAINRLYINFFDRYATLGSAFSAIKFRKSDFRTEYKSHIISIPNTDMVLDVASGTLIKYPRHGGVNQRLILEPTGESKYRIVYNEKCLVFDSSSTRLVFKECSDDLDQFWKIDKNIPENTYDPLPREFIVKIPQSGKYLGFDSSKFVTGVSPRNASQFSQVSKSGLPSDRSAAIIQIVDDPGKAFDYNYQTKFLTKYPVHRNVNQMFILELLGENSLRLIVFKDQCAYYSQSEKRVRFEKCRFGEVRQIFEYYDRNCEEDRDRDDECPEDSACGVVDRCRDNDTCESIDVSSDEDNCGDDYNAVARPIVESSIVPTLPSYLSDSSQGDSDECLPAGDNGYGDDSSGCAEDDVCKDDFVRRGAVGLEKTPSYSLF